MVLQLTVFWILTYGGLYLFVVTTRLLGAWCGVVSKPELMVERMRWDAKSVSHASDTYVTRYRSHLNTWIRGGRH